MTAKIRLNPAIMLAYLIIGAIFFLLYPPFSLGAETEKTNNKEIYNFMGVNLAELKDYRHEVVYVYCQKNTQAYNLSINFDDHKMYARLDEAITKKLGIPTSTGSEERKIWEKNGIQVELRYYFGNSGYLVYHDNPMAEKCFGGDKK